MRTNRAQKTSDYKLFETSPENRRLHDDPVLTASLVKYGFKKWLPVIVKQNGAKFRIIKGHNRFAAAERLGIPFWYLVVEDEIPDFFFLEGTREKWTPEDFGRARAQNNPTVAKVFAFGKKHGFPFTVSASLLFGESAGSGNAVRHIKQGTFTIAEDQSHAKAVAQITDYAREQGIEFASSRAFASAISMALRTPGFNPAMFLHRLKVRPKQITRRSRPEDYLIEIEALYNFGSHDLFPLKVEAMKASRARRKATLTSKKMMMG